MLTFEDLLPVIDEELLKRRSKWQITSIKHIDFDDVCQIIKIHLHDKWALWDQDRPFKNWLNTVITNQIRNIIRNNYGNLAPPCGKCPMNQGGNLCSFTKSGEKSSECPTYANWEKTKKSGYELRLPSSIDDPEDFSACALSDVDQNYDFEKSLARFDRELKKCLSKNNYLVFRLLYIEGASEEDVANALGFTTSESGRRAGYKQIYNIKKKILQTAKKVLEEKEIFYE